MHRITRPLRRLLPSLPVILTLLLASCAGKSSSEAPANKSPDNKPLPPTKPQYSKEQKLRKALGLDLDQGIVKTNADGEITEVDLEGTSVSDIAPLKGLSLEKLRLNFTNVTDISPVDGMPLTQLNLQGTQVKDIGPVKSLKKLKTLWLNDTPVTDLSPLKGMTLVSLDISGTPVTDLSPIAGMTSLLRLNLAHSKVQDLTPLRGLSLKRVIITPDKSMKGLAILRTMPTLTIMHTFFPPGGEREFLSRDEFFRRFDSGTLPKGK